MGAQNLGPRKVRAIARAVGVPLRWALVWSHVDSGRCAVFETEDGRRGEFDRVSGIWEWKSGS